MTSPLGQGPCDPLGSRVSLVGLQCLWACGSHPLPCSSRERRTRGVSLGLVPPRPLSGRAAVGPCRPAWRCPRDPLAAGRPAWAQGRLCGSFISEVRALSRENGVPSNSRLPRYCLLCAPPPHPCHGRLRGRAPKISFAARPARGRWRPRPGSPGPWVQGVCRGPGSLLASFGGSGGAGQVSGAHPCLATGGGPQCSPGYPRGQAWKQVRLELDWMQSAAEVGWARGDAESPWGWGPWPGAAHVPALSSSGTLCLCSLTPPMTPQDPSPGDPGCSLELPLLGLRLGLCKFVYLSLHTARCPCHPRGRAP